MKNKNIDSAISVMNNNLLIRSMSHHSVIIIPLPSINYRAVFINKNPFLDFKHSKKKTDRTMHILFFHPEMLEKEKNELT